MRDFLIGLGIAFVLACGAVPNVDCGWMEQEDFDTTPAPADKCVKITLGKGGHLSKAPTNGCEAENASSCIILMPGESARAFTPATAEWMAAGRLPGTRQNGAMTDGVCPLTCD